MDEEVNAKMQFLVETHSAEVAYYNMLFFFIAVLPADLDLDSSSYFRSRERTFAP